jgi:hypothetical protein
MRTYRDKQKERRVTFNVYYETRGYDEELVHRALNGPCYSNVHVESPAETQSPNVE